MNWRYKKQFSLKVPDHIEANTDWLDLEYLRLQFATHGIELPVTAKLVLLKAGLREILDNEGRLLYRIETQRKGLAVYVDSISEKNWEDHPELVTLDTRHSQEEFFSYTRELGVEVEVESRIGRLGRRIPHTCWRYFYTGGTFCVLTDEYGTLFIGAAVCSDDDPFCKKAGRAVAKYYALQAMKRAIEICGTLKDTVEAELPEDKLIVLDVVLSPELTVRGIALASAIELPAEETEEVA